MMNVIGSNINLQNPLSSLSTTNIINNGCYENSFNSIINNSNTSQVYRVPYYTTHYK